MDNLTLDMIALKVFWVFSPTPSSVSRVIFLIALLKWIVKFISFLDLVGSGGTGARPGTCPVVRES